MHIQIPDTTPVVAIFEFARQIGCAAHYENDEFILRPTANGQARVAVAQAMRLPAGDGERTRLEGAQ